MKQREVTKQLLRFKYKKSQKEVYGYKQNKHVFEWELGHLRIRETLLEQNIRVFVCQSSQHGGVTDLNMVNNESFEEG